MRKANWDLQEVELKSEQNICPCTDSDEIKALWESLQSILKAIKIFYAFIGISASSLQSHQCKLITNILRNNWGKFVVKKQLHTIKIILEGNKIILSCLPLKPMVRPFLYVCIVHSEWNSKVNQFFNTLYLIYFYQAFCWVNIT